MIRYVCTLSLCLFSVFLTGELTVEAQSTDSFASDDYKRFFKRNCYECHRGEDAEAGLDLSALSMSLDDPKTYKYWMHIFDRVEAGEMPPEEEVSQGEKKGFLNSSRMMLTTFEKERNQKYGRVYARRLTAIQLERTLHQLLGIDNPLAQTFPQGLSTQRFATIADGQSMSHYHLQQHLTAVSDALELAFQRALNTPKSFSMKLDPSQLVRRTGNDVSREPEPWRGLAAIWPASQPFVGKIRRSMAQEDGWVRVTVRAKAIRPRTGGVWASIHTGFLTATKPELNWVGSFETKKDMKEWSFETFLPRGHMIAIRPRDNTLKNGKFLNGWIQAGRGEKQQLTGIAFDWVKIERIYKGPDQQAVRKLLFDHVPIRRKSGSLATHYSGLNTSLASERNQGGQANNRQGQARRGNNRQRQAGQQRGNLDDQRQRGGQGNQRPQRRRQSAPTRKAGVYDFEPVPSSAKTSLSSLMLQFATRAYRRPVAKAQIQAYVQLAFKAYDKDKNFIESLRVGYQAILCSPHFLYFQESPGTLDDYALASRLSYMLWQAPPDQVLLDLAKKRQLTQQSVLLAQVDRMLKDPKGERFMEDLAHEWLDMKDIEFTTPDRFLYREFGPIVQYAMMDETHHYLKHLLMEDLSVTHLVDSEFTFMNSRLARFYNLPNVTSSTMKKIRLENKQRGGLLGQGAILKVTADGTVTSPILRGVWVLENILGQHVPPPPPNVPAVEPDIRGATSIKHMLEKHKHVPACAACHRKIDPIGFALENFNPVGQWRTKYGKGNRGAKVESAHRMHDGRTFKDFGGFKKILLRDPKMLARNMVDQFLTFGTGAPIGFQDRAVVDKIVQKTAKRKYGVKSLLIASITSPIFLKK